jgi:hypothetical protein
MTSDAGKLRDDLIAARALIDTPAKWRKDMSDSQPSCCAIVATNRVTGGRSSRHWQALADALPQDWSRTNKARVSEAEGCDVSDYPGVFVGEYNDDPATSHNDILALFDRAIDAATPEPV